MGKRTHYEAFRTKRLLFSKQAREALVRDLSDAGFIVRNLEPLLHSFLFRPRGPGIRRGVQCPNILPETDHSIPPVYCDSCWLSKSITGRSVAVILLEISEDTIKVCFKISHHHTLPTTAPARLPCVVLRMFFWGWVYPQHFFLMVFHLLYRVVKHG